MQSRRLGGPRFKASATHKLQRRLCDPCTGRSHHAAISPDRRSLRQFQGLDWLPCMRRLLQCSIEVAELGYDGLGIVRIAGYELFGENKLDETANAHKKLLKDVDTRPLEPYGYAITAFLYFGTLQMLV